MSLTRHVREHKFTDVVNTAIEDGERFAIHHAKGEYLDCGEPNGAFKAMNYLRQHPQEN